MYNNLLSLSNEEAMFSATLAICCPILITLMVMGGVRCYSDGAPPMSCYSMLPSHPYPDTHTLIPPITCNTNGQCSGLKLIVTRNGLSDGYYSCGSDHQSIEYL